MKKTILLLITVCTTIALSAQLRLDVEGDAKILGRLDLNTGRQNVFIGTDAGINTDLTSTGENVFIGFEAGTSNTTGYANVFIGRKAGRDNEIGKNNTFIGQNAGLYNKTGEDNTFIGRAAGLNNETGQDNTFIGKDAGGNNITGQDNTFIGKDAGRDNEIGKNNTFIGKDAGGNNITGQDNTFIGKQAGFSHNNTRSTMLGYNAKTTDSLDRAIAIGHNAIVACHNCAVIGGIGEDAVKVGIGTTTPLSDFHIKQTNTVDSKRGVRVEHHASGNYWTTYTSGQDNYNFKYNETLKGYVSNTSGNYINTTNFTSPNDRSDSRNSSVQSMEKVLDKVKRLQPATKKMTNSRNGQKEWGFVAEEVAKLFPEITPEQGDGQRGIIYDYFGILSIKAIQELAVTVEEQASENNTLKESNETQNEIIADLEEKMDVQNQQMNAQQQQINELKSLVEKLLMQNAETPKNTSYVLPLKQQALLAQNQPNPFRENTIVDYFVPADVQNAHIQVTGMDGKILGQVKIIESGKGQVTIQSKSYPAGTYFYSLVLDGQVMETKRMVLAR